MYVVVVVGVEQLVTLATTAPKHIVWIQFIDINLNINLKKAK